MSTGSQVLLLCAPGDSTNAVYAALTARFGRIGVVIEKPMSRLQMAKRRAKRLGYFKAAGQVVFAAIAVPILRKSSRARIEEIDDNLGLHSRTALPTDAVRVESVNSDAAREVLRGMNPSVVVVNGTRIISRETLECVAARFINMHAGITPLYRGVHGAYWALYEGRADLIGTTIHLVDPGIDTGQIIDHAFFSVTEKDNFATYPYLHTAFGIPLMLTSVEQALANSLVFRPPLELPSRLRYHPTLWEYLGARVSRGVR